MPLPSTETGGSKPEQVTTIIKKQPEVAQKVPGVQEKPLIDVLVNRDPDDPDSAIQKLLNPTPEAGEKSDFTSQKKAEEQYLVDTQGKYKGELDIRYADPSTKADYLQGQVTGYVEGVIGKASEKKSQEDDVKFSHEDTLIELSGQKFDQKTSGIVLAKAQERISVLFNSEYGSKSPEKQRMVAEQTKQYLELFSKAQTEGSLSNDISAGMVIRLVDENIGKLAYQDRKATENWLGDHGVRHIVGHNIDVSMKLADELERNGQKVSAVDRLMMHQIMIEHDMGYATDVVSKPINQGGFGADGGHNVLAAKSFREQAEDTTSPVGQVFSSEQAAIVHEGILHHDSRAVKFNLGDESPQAKKENVLSAIHVADNTHAFEKKLPEILYNHPDTLRIMRLMKTAGETGDDTSIVALRGQLISGIDKNSAFSDDDKTALKLAANMISKGSYERTVPRICGNKPEFEIDNKGVLTIDVTESAIHREVVGVFAQGQNEQLQKFLGDIAGIKNVDLRNVDSVISPEGTVVVKMRTGEGRDIEKTDYQMKIDELIKDADFSSFVIEDADLAADQALLQKQAESSQDKSVQLEKVEAVKKMRRLNMEVYQDSQKERERISEKGPEQIV
ncbi:hypothetical protein KKF69_00590 [Patescibacteria group bacterium]|nr:hypothetical protein [Patescibacteria group bacterium]